MRYAILTLVFIAIIGNCLWANDTTSFDFNQAWKEIEVYRRDRLPLSMAEKANEIYDAAVAEALPAHQVKALVYWIGSYVYKDD
ncbi:MAG: hypothetical protein U1B83_05515, partial [Candidatus Cloacimonadaceae bacterium]|nr:hypothetical protein [Candidatus Cloacimonadaceae bacterium]